MFFLLQLNAVIIFWLEPLILLYILLVYCVPTFVRNHIENTAKYTGPRPVLNLACIIEKVWHSWSGWSPSFTQKNHHDRPVSMPVNKKNLHNSLLFVVFFLSSFRIEDISSLKVPASFQGKKVCLIAAFCCINSMIIVV